LRHRVKAIWHAVKIRYRPFHENTSSAIASPRSLFLYALLFGGMVWLAVKWGRRLDR